MPEDARTAYLFQCTGEDLFAVSPDRTGSNIPRAVCTLGWTFTEKFQLGVYERVPAGVMPESILQRIFHRLFYLARLSSAHSALGRFHWRLQMKKLVIAAVAVIGLGIATPAHAASEIDCMVMWDKADLNKNGILDGDEATAYLDAIKKSVKKYGMKTVNQLSAAEFMAACTDDVFKISFYRA
jgi:hypothetical protein